MTEAASPKAAVVIPTYNRSSFLRQSLESLARQRFPIDEFDIVVADDGSADDTAEVARSFADRMRLKYWFQEDVGNRVSAARNAGARLTEAPVLIFLDTGTIAGPDFVGAHVAAHRDGPARAVVGYVYAYQPWEPFPGLADILAETAPEEAVLRHGTEPGFLDWRHDHFASVDFDLGRLAAPWLCYFGANCSVRSDDFWRCGGYDDDFREWGTEDLELGYRLHLSGLPFALTREGWAIEGPHERDMIANLAATKVNGPIFFRKHPGPVGELLWWYFANDELWPLERELRAVHDWRARVAGRSAASELHQATDDLDTAAGRIAVFGCGPQIPAGLGDAVLFDFDPDSIDSARASGHTVHAGIGIRTPLPDQSVDAVVVTSRLAGLWDRWHNDILAEAHRIGGGVRGPLVESLATG